MSQSLEEFWKTSLLESMPKSHRFKAVTDETSFILCVSKIPNAGIGVFCTHNISAGTLLRLFPDDGRLRTIEEMANSPRLALLANRYGVPKLEGCWSASDFGRMSVGHYLNHSDTPNAGYGVGWTWVSLRNIQQGEEITIDYNALSSADER